MSGKATLVGIRLVTEVLDRYHGPDARKLWLIAWAEKANDRTRAGWPTREVLAHRTGRSPSRASHIADELVTEGVLKRDGGGNRSGPARFILLPLADSEKGALSTHPKDGLKSATSVHPLDEPKGAPETHPLDEPKGAPETHPEDAGKGDPEPHPSSPGKGAARAHPKPEVKGAESPGKGAESSRKSADPISLPAETGPLPLIPSIDHPSQEPTGETPGPAGAPVTAQTIIAAFIDWVRGNDGDLTKRTIGQLAKQTGDLLAQGKPERHIRTGLANWFLADQNVATLDSFVNSAMNAAARGRASQNGHPDSGAKSTGAERAQQAVTAGLEVQAMIDEGKFTP